MRISEAMAAEWVMPEQPRVSTRASSMMPSLTLRVSLQAPCWGAHQPTPWVKPEMSLICFAWTHLPSSGMHMLYFSGINHGNIPFKVVSACGQAKDRAEKGPPKNPVLL